MEELPHLRIGIGHDTHRLKPGGPLRLGGIDVPFEFSLDGHSDADVLLHAITDAILGAAAMGDIGELFPDTDQENHQRDSADMLLKAMQKVAESGFQITNQVGVKAKTGEGVGAVGGGQAMMAQCVALLQQIR